STVLPARSRVNLSPLKTILMSLFSASGALTPSFSEATSCQVPANSPSSFLTAAPKSSSPAAVHPLPATAAATVQRISIRAFMVTPFVKCGASNFLANTLNGGIRWVPAEGAGGALQTQIDPPPLQQPNRPVGQAETYSGTGQRPGPASALRPEVGHQAADA